MNEKAIRIVFEEAVKNGYSKSYEEFKNSVQTNAKFRSALYQEAQKVGFTQGAEKFDELMGATIAPSAVEKKSPDQPISQEQPPTSQEPTQPSETALEDTPEQEVPEVEVPVTPEKEVQDALEKVRIAAGPFGTRVWYDKDGSFIKGPIGMGLSKMDWLGEFIDDMARGAYSGVSQLKLANAAANLNVGGATLEDAEKFMEALKRVEEIPPSEAMMELAKVNQNESAGFLDYVVLLAKNPELGPEIMLSSMVGMMNKMSLAAGGTVLAAGAAGGAIAGGVGAIPGAIASIPVAMGAASGTTDGLLTFADLVQEEAGGELTKEKLIEIMNDDEALSKIRGRAIARGVTIGIIDAITGKLGGKVYSKIAGKVGADGLPVAVSTARKAAGKTAAAITEMGGGSFGEFSGQMAAGQDLDKGEIILEGIAEGPMAIPTVLSETLKKPRIEINGEIVDTETLNQVLRSATREEIAGMDLQVVSDPDGNYSRYISRKRGEYAIEKELRDGFQGDAGALDDPTVKPFFDALIEAEYEYKNTGVFSRKAKLRENVDAAYNALDQALNNPGAMITPRSLNKKESASRDEIKESYEIGSVKTKRLQDALDDAAQKRAAYEKSASNPLTTKKKREALYDEAEEAIDKLRFAIQMEKDIVDLLDDVTLVDDQEISDAYDKVQAAWNEYMQKANEGELTREELRPYFDAYNEADKALVELGGAKLEQKKQSQTTETDAVQEQAAGEVPVQPETRPGEEMAEGEPQAEPEETTQEGVQEEEVTTPTEEVAGVQEEEATTPAEEAAEADPTEDDLVEMAAVVGRSMEPETGGAKGSRLDKLKTKVESAKKALSKTFSGVEIEIVDEETYRKLAGEEKGKTSKGIFRGEDAGGSGKIYLNAAKADGVTVAHEVAHAILHNTLLKNGGDVKGTLSKIARVTGKAVSKNSKLAKHLDAFANAYEKKGFSKNDVLEERFTELLGQIAENYDSLEADDKSTIKDFLQKVFKALGLDKVGFDKMFSNQGTDAEIIDLLNTLSRKIREGEAIEATDVEGVLGGVTDNTKSKPAPQTKAKPKAEAKPRAEAKPKVEAKAEPKAKANMEGFSGRIKRAFGISPDARVLTSEDANSVTFVFSGAGEVITAKLKKKADGSISSVGMKVTDKKGNPVKKLTKAQLEAYDQSVKEKKSTKAAEERVAEADAKEKKEPAKKEPVKKEPVKKEPKPKEEPAKKEPVKKEPAKKEPVKKEPAKKEDYAVYHAKKHMGIGHKLTDDIGIVQGFDFLGRVTYFAYKKDKTVAIDSIEISKRDSDVFSDLPLGPSLFTPDEIKKLKDFAKEIKNKELELEASTTNPFEAQGNVAATDSVPQGIKKFVAAINKALGMNTKILVITGKDMNKEQWRKHGLYGKLAHARVAFYFAQNSYQFGTRFYIPDADVNVIYYSGDLSVSQMFSVVSHELGHIIQQKLLSKAPSAVKRAIREDYEEWYAGLRGKSLEEVINETRDVLIQDLFEQKHSGQFDPGKHGYISSFAEYFADNVAKWARSSEKPKNLVEKFFKEVVDTLKKLHQTLTKADPGRSPAINEWLDGMYDSTGIKKQIDVSLADMNISDEYRKHFDKTVELITPGGKVVEANLLNLAMKEVREDGNEFFPSSSTYNFYDKASNAAYGYVKISNEKKQGFIKGGILRSELNLTDIKDIEQYVALKGLTDRISQIIAPRLSRAARENQDVTDFESFARYAKGLREIDSTRRIPANAGQGIGKAEYIMLAKSLLDGYNIRLTSDFSLTPYSSGLWKSFERMGYARWLDFLDRYEFVMKKDASVNSIKKQIDLDGGNSIDADPNEQASKPYKVKKQVGASVANMIQDLRDAGYNDQSIRYYLTKVEKIKAKDVDAALKATTQAGVDVPSSFSSIKAGQQKGQELFERVMRKKDQLMKERESSGWLSKSAIRQKVSEFSKGLRDKIMTDDQINEKIDQMRSRLEKTKKTKAEIDKILFDKRAELVEKADADKAAARKKTIAYGKKLREKNEKLIAPKTLSQIFNEVVDFMESDAVFEGEGDGQAGISTSQAKMILDLQKALGLPRSKELSSRMRGLRAAVRERKRAGISLQEIKKRVFRTINTNLPIGMFSKPEVRDLMKALRDADESNIQVIVDQVMDALSVAHEGKMLELISQMLDGKYTERSFGRKKGLKVDADTLDLINIVKKYLAKAGATVQEVIDMNAELMAEVERLEVLSTTQALTREEEMTLSALAIAHDLNTARHLMEEGDSSRTELLTTVHENLFEIIEFGRSALQEEKRLASERYNEDASIAWEAITGEEVDFNAPDSRERLDESSRKIKSIEDAKKRRDTVAKRLEGFFKDIIHAPIKRITLMSEDLLGYLSRINTMPSDVFGGKLRDIISDRIDESIRNYKEGLLALDAAINNKLKEVYGKNYKKVARSFKDPVYRFTRNPDAVEAAKLAYDLDPTPENKRKLDKVVQENEVVLSQSQMGYLYNQYKDPSTHNAFESRFGKDYKKVMEQIDGQLDDRMRAFADWQVDVLFPMLYDRYNSVYRRIYRTNMPWSDKYAGRLYREGFSADPIDLLGDPKGMKAVVTAASTKSRVENKSRIQTMDIDTALRSYLRDMEYFAAMAESVRDVSKIFDNPYIRTAIKDIHGKEVLDAINNKVRDIANNGYRKGEYLISGALNWATSAFVISNLALKPVIMLKQLASFIVYADDIGYRNWVKYSAKNMTELRKVYKEVKENSIYMQDRAKGANILKVLEPTFNNSLMDASMFSGERGQFFTNVLMYLVKMGDAGAIYMGGLANYSYYKDEYMRKNPNASEADAVAYAIRGFERDTKKAQQSSDISDKDMTQQGSALYRAFNLFMTAPKQYNRKTMMAVRNIKRKVAARDMGAGEGSLRDNLRTLFTYHVFAPAVFQYAVAGFPGLADEWDEDDTTDMIRVMIIGNLNSIFLFGQVLDAVADLITGKPWAGENYKTLGLLMWLMNVIKELKRADEASTPNKRDEHYRKAILEATEITGLPANTVDRMVKNTDIILDGKYKDEGELFLRVMMYSDYTIEGAKKQKAKKKDTFTKTEMKELFPDMYEEDIFEDLDL